MNKLAKNLSVAAVSIGLIGAATTATASSASATPAAPGQVCNVLYNTDVYSGPGNGNRIYTVAQFDGVRITDGPYYSSNTGNYYWFGHGNGHTGGFFLADDRYWNCS